MSKSGGWGYHQRHADDDSALVRDVLRRDELLPPARAPESFGFGFAPGSGEVAEGAAVAMACCCVLLGLGCLLDSIDLLSGRLSDSLFCSG